MGDGSGKKVSPEIRLLRRSSSFCMNVQGKANVRCLTSKSQHRCVYQNHVTAKKNKNTENKRQQAHVHHISRQRQAGDGGNACLDKCRVGNALRGYDGTRTWRGTSSVHVTHSNKVTALGSHPGGPEKFRALAGTMKTIEAKYKKSIEEQERERFQKQKEKKNKGARKKVEQRRNRKK